MKKALLVLIFAMFTLVSCSSIKNMVNPDYSVHYDLSESQVIAAAAKVEAEKNYLKKFDVKDSMGKLHEVIIYDDYYLKIDNQIYAFKYDKLMCYQLSLNIFGNQANIDGSEKVIGFTCWATSISNPELTVHIIFAQELFAKKHYNSQYEASQINGVYFAGIKSDDGYIDAWGKWKNYTWTDYFEKIFGTVDQDVKRKMYMGLEVSR
ncbi:MAG: hypothetical protein MJ162_08430 [Treponema sp.]|nr:hypothetical protein [Treponema sp.]